MHDEIRRWREEIDAIDRQLLDLVSARALAALEIGARKRDSDTPVFDRERERAVLARARRENPGPLPAEAVERLFERIIHESRMLEGAAWAASPAPAGGVRA